MSKLAKETTGSINPDSSNPKKQFDIRGKPFSLRKWAKYGAAFLAGVATMGTIGYFGNFGSIVGDYLSSPPKTYVMSSNSSREGRETYGPQLLQDLPDASGIKLAAARQEIDASETASRVYGLEKQMVQPDFDDCNLTTSGGTGYDIQRSFVDHLKDRKLPFSPEDRAVINYMFTNEDVYPFPCNKGRNIELNRRLDEKTNEEINQSLASYTPFGFEYVDGGIRLRVSKGTSTASTGNTENYSAKVQKDPTAEIMNSPVIQNRLHADERKRNLDEIPRGISTEDARLVSKEVEEKIINGEGLDSQTQTADGPAGVPIGELNHPYRFTDECGDGSFSRRGNLEAFAGGRDYIGCCEGYQ